MLKEMAEPLVFVPTFVAGVESFLAGGAMVVWPLAAELSRVFFLNAFGLKDTSVK